jgi:phage-related protein
MADFNIDVGIPPDAGLQASSSPNVLIAAYGDGYEQRATNGINNVKESWSLSWTNRTSQESGKIERFLQEAKGVSSFDWYPPGTVIISTTETSGPFRLKDSTQAFTDRYINASIKVGGSIIDSIKAIYNSTEVQTFGNSFGTSGIEYEIYPIQRYKCDKWTIKINQGNFHTITATFTKVFEP